MIVESRLHLKPNADAVLPFIAMKQAMARILKVLAGIAVVVALLTPVAGRTSYCRAELSGLKQLNDRPGSLTKTDDRRIARF